MLDLKCVGCGCTIPPDSMKCPNCGHQHAEVRAKPKSNGNGITVGRIAYSITCPSHGKISIVATVAAPLNRCPFC